MKDVFIDFNVKFGLEKIWKWKWWILGASAAAGIISIVVSLRIPNEFKSTSSFIPPEISSLTEMVFNAGGVSYRGFEAADEEDIDRTVDYLSSRDVTDSLARRFDLYTHYGLTKGGENADKAFYRIFQGNNQISFGSNSVVKISCWDQDPEVASHIANAYLGFAENFFEGVSQRRTAFAATEKELTDMRKQRVILLDSLSGFRARHNLYHFDNAGDAVSDILAQKMRNDPKFNEDYDKMYSLELQLNTFEERFADLESEYQARKVNIEQYPNLIHITSTAEPSTFKDRPKRSIIVIICVMGMFIFSCFLAVVLDRSKDRLPI